MPIPLYPGAPQLLIRAIKVPITPKGRIGRSVVFDDAGATAGNFSNASKDKDDKNDKGDGSLAVLPNKNGLYGLTLDLRYEHYHNFLFYDGGTNPLSPASYNFGAVSEGFLLDNNGIVAENLSKYKDLAMWFSWQAITPLPDVSSANNGGNADGSGADGGGADADSDVGSVDSASPKWSYILMQTPQEEYGQNGSFITPDNNSARSKVMLPFQGQKNSHNNASGSVHWGLKRKLSNASRGSFYIDIYTPKSVDFKAANQPTAEEGEGVSSFASLVDHSYIIIDIKNGKDNYYRLELSTLRRKAQFYQMVESKNKEGNDNSQDISFDAKLLAEYSGPDALTLLQGDKDGKLRLSFQNVMNTVVISNNVDGNEFWVISKPYIAPKKDDSEETEAAEVTEQLVGDYMNLGGAISVYGGNISCAIAYCHLNYAKESTIQLNDFTAIGDGRKGETQPFIAGDSGRIVQTIPGDLLTNGKFYRCVAGRVNNADLTDRPDVGDKETSSITITDTMKSGKGPYETVLSTTMIMRAGILIHGKYKGINLGYATTPVLQYLRQEFKKDVSQVTQSGDLPCARIRSMELTRQLEGYHTATSTGSVTFNALNDEGGVSQLNRVRSMIAKSTYVEIDADYGNGEFKNDGGVIFTGILSGGQDMTRAGERTLTFELNDYWKIFEAGVVVNSPYFDGEPVDQVVKYWVDRVGLVDANQSIVESNESLGVSFDFDAPQTKFPDKEAISEVIKGLAKKYSFITYFDAEGVFVFRKQPSIVTGGRSVVPSAIFSSAHVGTNENVKLFAPYSGNAGVGNASDPYIAYSLRNMSWNTNDIINQIIIITVDSTTRDYIVKADINTDSLLNPDAEGFLGYLKPWVQEEALIGSENSANKMLREYTKMYQPPYSLEWKTFGGEAAIDVDILDVVKIDGAPVIVQKIAHSFNAATQTWDIDWGGEWIYPPSNKILPATED